MGIAEKEGPFSMKDVDDRTAAVLSKRLACDSGSAMVAGRTGDALKQTTQKLLGQARQNA